MIENASLFTDFEKLGVGIDLCLYAQGRLSRTVLQWLASEANVACEIVHFGDYDPVGLAEYHRLRIALGERVSFYIPEKVEWLFDRYAAPKLLRGRRTQRLLNVLRGSTEPVVQRITRLIDKYNGGLEQEALLIPSSL